MNTPSRVAFLLRMHHKNDSNVSSGLATHWGRLLWIHCWFEYNVGAPRIQAAGHPLYFKGDLIAIALQPDYNLDCGSRAHVFIVNNDLLLIV